MQSHSETATSLAAQIDETHTRDRIMSSSSVSSNHKDHCIYFAAALFNTKECLFNVAIAKKLELLGHKVYLPQRDGFEFSNLTSLLPDDFTEEDKSKTVNWIIYLADLAKLSKGTVCLANLDEPLDPGVLIEIMYAKQLGIPTIGYRCDSRTPFGAPQSWNFGMHFFPLF